MLVACWLVTPAEVWVDTPQVMAGVGTGSRGKRRRGDLLRTGWLRAGASLMHRPDSWTT